MIKKKSKNIKNKDKQTMNELLTEKSSNLVLPQVGDLIEGKIIKKSKNSVILDLGPLGTGIVYGGELKETRSLFKELKIGQSIAGMVLDPENEDGYVELSLKEANMEKNWGTLKEKKQLDEIITVKVTEANRGGLVVEVSSVIGFLPVSQLSTKNYPRVEGGDKNKILTHLNQFIGKELKVKIISLDQNNEKLIVSEKAIEREEIQKSLKNYKEGDVIEGTVSGLTDFGAFIKFGDNLEGLAHISELDWQIINHPSEILQENEAIKAKIINIEAGQVFLSLKALKQDPWEKAEGQYKSGQMVKGTITKINPFGALVKIGQENIYGLAHVSEFSKNNQKMEETINLGKSYEFEILSLEPKAHKMFLSFKK